MKQFKMNERQRFSIRKFSIGAASVLLGSVFFVANPATEVQAAESSTEVVAQDRDVKPDTSSDLSSSETSIQNPSVGQAETQGTEKKESGTPSKDGEGKAKSTVENTGDEKVDGVVKPVSGESSPVFEEEKDKKEVQPELEEETVSIGRRSKSPQSQDRSVEKQNEGSAASSTSYINGEGSYSLSDDIHKLLQNLKNSAGNQEQVQKLNEAYEKFNAALGTSETGLVDQEIFNTALEEYRKASQLQQGEAANLDGNLRHSRETSSLKVGVAKGLKRDPKLSNEKIIPSDGHPIGNNIRFLAESSSGKEIRRITVKAYDPQANSGRGGFTVDAVKNKLGLTTSGLQGSGSKKWVDLTGHIPDNRFGVNNIIVEAEDSSGYTQSTTVGVTRPLPKASFTTKNEALNGKANKEGNDRPVVSGKIPYPVETNNIPSDAELKAYLVTGGRVDDSRYIPGASDYTTIAVTRIKADGTFDFVPPEYTSNTVGTRALKLVVKYTKKGTNETYYEGLESLFSNDSLQATEPVDKSKLTTARNTLDGLAKETDPTPGKTTSTANAYKTAKQEAEEAVRKADEVIQDQNATADKVSTALNTVNEKTEALKQAKNKLKEAASETARNALRTSAEALEKASTTNKTPKSVEAYNQKYEALKTELENAKTEALNIANKGADASKEEVETSQGKVNGIKARLDEAARVLVEQADKGQLTTARNTLDGLAKETDPTPGKTTSTANAYKTAKQEAEEAVRKADEVIQDQNATSQTVSDEIEKLKSAMKKLQEAKDGLRDVQIPSHSTEKPTKPDQGATETPTAPSEPAPQPSQPTAPSQPASPVPAPSSAPTQAPPRVAATPSASSTSTQAPAQEQVDKSELRALSQELDQRLKALATVSDPKIDAAKAVLLDAQKALEDSALTEQGLRTAVESVKAALDSLKDVKANASDSKPAQDKKDAKQGTEDSKDSDKMTETNSVPAGVIVVSLLALLGVIAFWLVRRKKESEIQQLSTELTKVLGQLDAEKADKKVLAKAKKLLQETLDFVKEENGSAETEAKLVEELKAILAKLK
ncbi:surface anchored protein [Streptococcus pseudopneumoniae]|uniref:Surface anchored protein n=1 Tax=Streptococcus pseudopneumoniae TaxID=257758 RepID=A0A0T8U962_9STRE|nr:surface anchored protein [Streptococcus pseudopneumoniae]